MIVFAATSIRRAHRGFCVLAAGALKGALVLAAFFVSACDSGASAPAQPIVYKARLSDGRTVEGEEVVASQSGSRQVQLRVAVRGEPVVVETVGAIDIAGAEADLPLLRESVELFLTSPAARDAASACSKSCLGGRNPRLMVSKQGVDGPYVMQSGNPAVVLDATLNRDGLVSQLLMSLLLANEMQRSPKVAEARARAKSGDMGRDEFAWMVSHAGFSALQAHIDVVEGAIGESHWPETIRKSAGQPKSVEAFMGEFDSPKPDACRSSTLIGQFRREWDRQYFSAWVEQGLSAMPSTSNAQDLVVPVEHGEMWFRPVKHHAEAWQKMLEVLTQAQSFEVKVWNPAPPCQFVSTLAIHHGTPARIADGPSGQERVQRIRHSLVLATSTSTRQGTMYQFALTFEDKRGRVLRGYVGSNHDAVFLVPEWMREAGILDESNESGRCTEASSAEGLTPLGPPVLRPLPVGPTSSTFSVDWLPTKADRESGVRQATQSTGRWPPCAAPRRAVFVKLPTMAMPGLREELDLAEAIAFGLPLPESPKADRRTLPLVPIVPAAEIGSTPEAAPAEKQPEKQPEKPIEK